MKNKLLGILVTEEEHKEIKEMATQQNKTMSDFLREFIFPLKKEDLTSENNADVL